jgi:hypothetical protein
MLMAAGPLVLYTPSHLLFKKLFNNPPTSRS